MKKYYGSVFCNETEEETYEDSTSTVAILTKIFRSFPQFHQENRGIVKAR